MHRPNANAYFDDLAKYPLPHMFIELTATGSVTVEAGRGKSVSLDFTGTSMTDVPIDKTYPYSIKEIDTGTNLIAAYYKLRDHSITIRLYNPASSAITTTVKAVAIGVATV